MIKHRITNSLDLDADAREYVFAYCNSLNRLVECKQDSHALDADALFDNTQNEVSKIYSTRHPIKIIATIAVLTELAKQGKIFEIEEGEIYSLEKENKDLSVRKARRQLFELQKSEQLNKESVQRFIKRMESLKFFRGRRVSIFSLMRDGREIANAIRNSIENDDLEFSKMRDFVNPYIQVVESKSQCQITGLALMDIWRYFRMTWTTPYQSVPGRSILFLVRDKAADGNPVMGIGAISSAPISLTKRDAFIGWDASTKESSSFTYLSSLSSSQLKKWILETIDLLISEIFIGDFVEEGIITTAGVRNSNESTIQALTAESIRAKEAHFAYAKKSNFTKHTEVNTDDKFWEHQARQNLFRSKRASELAYLLNVENSIRPAISNPGFIIEDLISSNLRQSLAGLVKRMKSRFVGTAIGELSVCGAVAPYNELLGGKLVAALMTGPEIVQAIRKKYRGVPSIIASSMAGKAVIRDPSLVLVSTSSLYGIRPNQYDRVSIPVELIGGNKQLKLAYKFIGNTQGQGTFQFGNKVTRALDVYTKNKRKGGRVNFIFGEGASPKLRNIRTALDQLGFDSARLISHGFDKSQYVVALISNLTKYLLGIEKVPKYMFSLKSPKRSSSIIVHWWIDRWVVPRLLRDDLAKTLLRLESHSITYPIQHGARVITEPDEIEQANLF